MRALKRTESSSKNRPRYIFLTRTQLDFEHFRVMVHFHFNFFGGYFSFKKVNILIFVANFNTLIFAIKLH